MRTKLFLRFWAILIFVITGWNHSYASAGELLEYTLVKSFPEPELKAFFKKQGIPKIILPVKKEVSVYEIVYTTTYTDGSIVKASGLLYVPQLAGEADAVMIYNHGTEMCRDRSCSFTDEQTICLAFATDGYVVVAPDYVGLGKGERMQLFINAFTESHASVDMLIASKALLSKLGVNTNKQLFVTGYSQGGHAAMATTRLLQQEYADRFPVTASSPMSGPYNIEKTVYDGRNTKYAYPATIFLLMQSYFESKGDYKNIASVFNPPYDTIIPPMLDGNYPIEEIDKILPDPVSKTFKESFYLDFINNPESGLRKYLRDNNVYDWKPDMPMLMCYCNADIEVNYHNSTDAYETMKKNGNTTARLKRVGKKFGHVNCAQFAIVYTKMFFDGFRNGHPGSSGPAFKRMLLNIGKLFVKAY